MSEHVVRPTVRVSYHGELDGLRVATHLPTPEHPSRYVTLDGGVIADDVDVTFFADPVDVAAMFRRFADSIDAVVAANAAVTP